MLFLTVLVWLGSLAVLVGMASLGRLQPVRKPGPPSSRRRVFRLACGAAAVGMAGLMAAVTIREASSAYGPPEFLDLRLPASGVPDLDRQPGDPHKGRFLIHMILAECSDGLIRVVRGRTEEIRWTGSLGPAVSDRLSRGLSSLSYELRLQSLWVDPKSGALEAIASCEVQTSGLGSHSSVFRSMKFPAVQTAMSFESLVTFSLQGTSRPTMVLLFDLTPLREDTPLRQASVEEVLALRGREVWEAQISKEGMEPSRDRLLGAPGASFLVHLGPAALPFIVLAMLLAGAFPRSSTGLARSLACLVLFAGMLDGLALRIHTSHLRDVQAKEEERLIACAHVRSTFFFGRSARESLDAVIQAPSSPERLKRSARYELRDN
jgi:hypothetical protein